MEILKILEEQGNNLYPEDLDFFETELATGEQYDAEYQEECKSKIQQLRMRRNGDGCKIVADPGERNRSSTKKLFVDTENLEPAEADSVKATLTPAQLIFNEIKAMRETGTYKTDFKKYAAQKSEIDATFVDAHYAAFQPWELNAIITVKQMGEDFIEKYFGALDSKKIARYQQFSEAFFIKHFSQLDASIVLEHGKNEWRKKEKRSRQLDVFLRLKGVKI